MRILGINALSTTWPRLEAPDAVIHSPDPRLARPAADMDPDGPRNPLRQDLARRAPESAPSRCAGARCTEGADV
ncbi:MULTISPECIES: hypothetical protein [unclassified Streptomyces]|uniref:hypothetical protein n=1 Tax=unclassified Streptomyces TaxID=2593676 RepID=UPI0033ACAC91